MNLNSWWRYVPMLLNTPKFRRRRSSRAVGCDVTSFLSFFVPRVTWHDNRFVKISWNRNPCFSRLRPTELTVYYRIWTLNVFSKILWAVRVSESLSRGLHRDNSCCWDRCRMPRRKRTTDEGGRRAKVSRVEDNEETLVISDSENEEVTWRYCWVYSRQPHTVCSASFKGLCVV